MYINEAEWIIRLAFVVFSTGGSPSWFLNIFIMLVLLHIPILALACFFFLFDLQKKNPVHKPNHLFYILVCFPSFIWYLWSDFLFVMVLLLRHKKKTQTLSATPAFVMRWAHTFIQAFLHKKWRTRESPQSWSLFFGWRTASLAIFPFPHITYLFPF